VLIGSLLTTAVQKHGDDLALAVERPAPPVVVDEVTGAKSAPALPMDQWTQWTWREYEAEANLCAKAMLKTGVPQHQSVNIYGFNAPEWIIGAMGGVLCGVKVAGIYPTDTAEQVHYKSTHSRANIAIIEDEQKFQRYIERINEKPDLKAIVMYGDCPSVRWSHFNRANNS